MTKLFSSLNTRLAFTALALLSSATVAQAQLLTSAYETQLETWLGQGDKTFTNIFTSIAGDGKTATDFHNAADGKGPTFVLVQVGSRVDNPDAYGLPTQVIGGYNPQSWSSAESYNDTPTDAERTAFIFNLSYSLRQNQNLIGQGSSGSGQIQTYNLTGYGPTFGGGQDLFVNFSLSQGYALNYSYGGTSAVQNITKDGYGWMNSLVPYYDEFSISRLEVFTIAPASTPPNGNSAVPEPSTYGLIGAATLLGLIAYRRSKKA